MYEVGQVLYLVALKTAKIVPSRITAVTITKTLEGEIISHTLEFADAPGQEVKLEDLNVEIFKAKNDLRKFMMTNATAAVEQQLNEAEMKVVEWCPPPELPKKKRARRRKKTNVTAPLAMEDEPENGLGDHDQLTVILEDGVKANVVIPPELR